MDARLLNTLDSLNESGTDSEELLGNAGAH